MEKTILFHAVILDDVSNAPSSHVSKCRQGRITFSSYFVGFLLVLGLAFIPNASFAEEYSLDSLYRLALESSETIRVAEEDVYISERDRDRAMAALIPTLSAFGSYTRYKEEQGDSLSFFQPESSTSWGLKLDQSLSLSGREFTALKIAKASIEKSRFGLSAVTEEYLLTVASAYYDLLKAKKGLDIANANVERLTKHRDAAQVRLKVGEITKTVLLRAEAELSGAQSDLIKAENMFRYAKAVLARTVGITGEYEVKETLWSGVTGQDLKGLGVIDVNCQLSTFDCLKQTALSERCELKSAELDREIAAKQVSYTKGLYWPSISLEGVYSLREDHPDAPFENRENIYGIVRFDFPFYEGGLRVAEVKQENARLKQAEYALTDLKDSIALEVENAYLAMITASGVLEKLEAEAEYASDNYNAVTKQFQYGLANSIDVMDANTLLVTAERELANAKYDYQFAVIQLKRSTGTLLREFGKKGTPLQDGPVEGSHEPSG